MRTILSLKAINCMAVKRANATMMITRGGRAFIGDNMSGDSNEVRYACDESDKVSTIGGGSGSGCFIDLIFR
jgi:hypothetical protein